MNNFSKNGYSHDDERNCAIVSTITEHSRPQALYSEAAQVVLATILQVIAFFQ